MYLITQRHKQAVTPRDIKIFFFHPNSIDPN